MEKGKEIRFRTYDDEFHPKEGEKMVRRSGSYIPTLDDAKGWLATPEKGTYVMETVGLDFTKPDGDAVPGIENKLDEIERAYEKLLKANGLLK